MAEAAEYGLMLWDGKSNGAVNNVVNLSRDHKPVVVYVSPTKQFRSIKTFDDIKGLLAQAIRMAWRESSANCTCTLHRVNPRQLESEAWVHREEASDTRRHACGDWQHRQL
jgi:hypothetical protein